MSKKILDKYLGKSYSKRGIIKIARKTISKTTQSGAKFFRTMLSKANMVRLFLALISIGIITAGFLGLALRNTITSEKAKNQKLQHDVEQIKRDNDQLNQQKNELERQLKAAQDAITFNPEKLLEYTNQERIKNGVRPLTLNSYLTKSAKAKANDMVARNYWAHNSPDNVEPWVFFQRVGYRYFKAGENLAYGYSTGLSTTTGWMNSPTHKENLLSVQFTEVGFGVLRNILYQGKPNTIVVAHYGSQL